MATREWLAAVLMIVLGCYLWPLIVGLRYWMHSQRDTAKILAKVAANEMRVRGIR